MSTFSTQCFRDFKQFIGELTAAAAGIHSSVHYTAECIQAMENKDPWADIAHKYEIKVNGLISDRVMNSASRLNIVSIYSGFDLFLSTFRKQYFELSGNEWKANKGDTPFDEFYANLNHKTKVISNEVSESKINVVDYYRLSRNAIVHPSKENIQNVEDFYKEKENCMKDVRKFYSMRYAPNNFDSLDFHDVKLFSRLLLDILPIIDMAADPGDEKLKNLIPFSNWVRYGKENRRKNAAIGYLKQNYGISDKRARRIYDKCGSLA